MTIPENPESYNFDFLSKMKPGERVGLDKKTGKFYRPLFFSWESGVTTPILQDLASESVTEKLKEPKFHQVTYGRNEYLKVIGEFAKKNLLTPMQRQTIAYNYYNQRKLDLEATKALTKEEIEAMVAVEMSFDPNILEADRKKLAPEFVKGGEGGVYFLKNLNGETIGVFKPMFQELYMPDNPKGKSDVYNKDKPTRDVRKGHQEGTGWLCEVAAYEIDKEGYIGVPFTSKMLLPFPKKWENGIPDKTSIEMQAGSFQLFVKHDATLAEIVADIEKSQSPEIVKKLQDVAAFDLTIGNGDRNYNNLLGIKEQEGGQINWKFIPIDHGLILLDNLNWEKPLKFSEGLCHLLVFPQLKEPIVKETADWILNYDLENKCKALRKMGISESAISDHRLRVFFMKEGVRQGFNLKELGELSMVNKFGRFSSTTWLDDLVLEIKKEKPKDQADFESKFQELLKERLSKLKPPQQASRT